MKPWKIVHIGTGVIVGRFETYLAASQWREMYGATSEYKNRWYRIVREELS